jgi:ABC-type multidrug transport system permease subunit
MATETAPRPEVVGVSVAGGTWKDDLRATKMVWKRELIRYSRNRVRIVTSLAQPVLFLFVLGSGLSPIVNNTSGPHVDFKTFMFPGVIAMTILFTAIFSAVSIVWDREFGFLREMMVAPIRRGALVTGKSFQVVMQLFVLPMFFLSGAVFPLNHLPRWLSALTKIDPLTYIVDPMRRAVFAHVSMTAAARRSFSPGMHWGSWRLPVAFELMLAAIVIGVNLGISVRLFSKQD